MIIIRKVCVVDNDLQIDSNFTGDIKGLYLQSYSGSIYGGWYGYCLRDFIEGLK